MLIRPASPLFAFLREQAASATQRLMDNGFYDPMREGPNVEQIETLLKPFLEKGERTRISDENLNWILTSAVWIGPAFQALGNLDIASLWYQIGQHEWRGHARFSPVDTSTPRSPGAEAASRQAAARLQESSAICAALANHTSRAQQLFEWDEQNWAMTDQEVQEEEKLRNYQYLWQNLGFRVFALTWLGTRWEEVRKLVEIGRRMIEKTRNAGQRKDFREPQLLIEIGWQSNIAFQECPDGSARISETTRSRVSITNRSAGRFSAESDENPETKKAARKAASHVSYTCIIPYFVVVSNSATSPWGHPNYLCIACKPGDFLFLTILSSSSCQILIPARYNQACAK